MTAWIISKLVYAHIFSSRFGILLCLDSLSFRAWFYFENCKMPTSEKFCLKWNEFQNNATAAFGSLRKDTDFADVTLLCEDNQYVEAHKVILAASSPFFQDMLKKIKHTHPLIYMRGMKSEDLLAVVDFLYYGEVSIWKDNLDNFLAIANELSLKGMTKESSEESNFNDEGSPPRTPEIKSDPEKVVEVTKALQDKKHLDGETLTVVSQTECKENETTELVENNPNSPKQTKVALFDETITGEMRELDKQIKNMITRGESILPNGKKSYGCIICGKEGYWNVVMDHVELHHINSPYELVCSFCEKTFKNRPALRNHKSQTHKRKGKTQ